MVELRITSAYCISYYEAWTVFTNVPRYKTAENAGVNNLN